MSTDIARLEGKVDGLVEAVTKLVLFEERQSVQAVAIQGLSVQVGIIKTDIDDLDRALNKWINRGVGAWAIVATLWTIWQAYRGHF